jgi:hypothetical protein
MVATSVSLVKKEPSTNCSLSLVLDWPDRLASWLRGIVVNRLVQLVISPTLRLIVTKLLRITGMIELVLLS